MDFMDRLQTLANLIEKQNAGLNTEEAARDRLVTPFIAALGFKVFDRREVFPEYSVDVVGNIKETIDYALFLDGRPVVLFECKPWGCDLSAAPAVQLRNCFHAASAGIGILTNGQSYFFYADLEEKGIMDGKPFMHIDLLDLDKKIISYLQLFLKHSFDLKNILSAARELQYIQSVKNVLLEEYSSPSQEFIRFFATQVPSGRTDHQILPQLAPIVSQAFKQFVDDRINDRLRSVLIGREEEGGQNISDAGSGFVKKTHPDTFITDEEFEGFFVVSVT